MARSGKKRENPRIPKSDRKNLRLWAEGVRERILRPHIDGYAAALDQGWRQERKYCKKVCLEFHARVSWETEDHEEPVLDENWDPASVTKKSLPLPEEQEKRKRARMKILDKRIRRWFTYRIRRIRKHRSSAGLDPTKDPYAVLLAKLSGLSAPPKARQAFQQWMRETPKEEFEPIVQERWEKEQADGGVVGSRTKTPKVGFRAGVGRSLFNALPASEQKDIGVRATKEATEAKEEYVKALKNPPSTKPEDRQRCIDAIPDFVGPILRGLSEYTGMHATLIMGGPMPKYGGDIRTVHTSYGRNNAALPVHWAQWDKTRFQRQVADFMIEFLQTAYRPEECADAALTAVNALSAAKYRIDESKQDESDSDSSSSSGSSSDSSSESDSDLEHEGGKRKRHKKKKKGSDRSGKELAAAAAGSGSDSESEEEERARGGKKRQVNNETGPTVRIYEDGLTYDQVRERNIKRNAASLAAIKASQELAAPTPTPSKPPPKPRARKTDVSAAQCALRRAAPRITRAITGDIGPGRITSLDNGSSTAERVICFDAFITPDPHLPHLDDILVPCPPKAAVWFVEARAEMTKVDLGCHFQALLTAWTRVEDASRFEHGPQNLSTNGRPGELKTWISRKRGKTGPDPIVTDASAYASKWQGWWDSLQPAWRVKNEDGTWVAQGPYGPDGKEWGDLYRWGVNAVTNDADLQPAWVAAVNDVCWMMEGLAIFYEMFNKRF
ncbi:hypothetical protein C8R43DRAFT_961081 [Mycena crocata]|nr:hypothetical protein C8R43DRAFT_961081 [Mycena crocata]